MEGVKFNGLLILQAMKAARAVNLFEVIRILARGVIDGQAVMTSKIALEDIVERL
ncbi:hypothetical protein ACE1MS_08350 [Lysinibacillus sp. fkY74-1]|uniref:hypothetical protein n=1 Tax=Lysinibacillus fusiformis TaxID=28031 RepID=UPI0018E64D3D|nr:hypothetical protein [Lysinibacillus fusiformis]MBI6862184.1 hypothetical protein [Lysinibacillus fusiformis]